MHTHKAVSVKGNHQQLVLVAEEKKMKSTLSYHIKMKRHS